MIIYFEEEVNLSAFSKKNYFSFHYCLFLCCLYIYVDQTFAVTPPLKLMGNDIDGPILSRIMRPSKNHC